MFIIFSLFLLTNFSNAIKIIDRDTDIDISINRTCIGEEIPKNTGCIAINNNCGIRIVDGIFTNEECNLLENIAIKGFSVRENAPGPSILDINTGYIRDSSNGLENLYRSVSLGIRKEIFHGDDYAHYFHVINKLKETIEKTFGIGNNKLKFTAPTFFTRLNSGLDINNNNDNDNDTKEKAWEPAEIHDEYWHSHIDRENTEHYHYSGLLYLSTYKQNFTGGRLGFQDAQTDGAPAHTIVEPRMGRVALFTSGKENPHYVERLTKGQRLVLAFWFTCDTDREFQTYLDGREHVAFSKKVGDQLAQQARQQQQQQQQKQSNEL